MNKKLVLCALTAALTCVLAPVSFVLATAIPITLGTLAVMLSGTLLGGCSGAVSQAVYLLIGVVGLPVCAGYTPALPRLLGPTGGYLIGYIPLAFLCGALYTAWGRNARGVRKYAALTGAMLICTVVLYAFGTAWYCIYSGTDVLAALTVCVVPFLIGDGVKIAVVAALTPQLEKALGRLPDKPFSKRKNNEKTDL